VNILNSSQYIDYIKLVAQIRGTMLYHQLNYIKFAAELLNAELLIFAEYENEKITAACPWIVKDGEYGSVYNSLAFFGANGGILAINQKNVSIFEKKMLEEITKQAVSYSYITNVFEDNKLDGDHFLMQNRIAQVTTLPKSADEDALMGIFHFKTRNMVRKAFKENIVFSTTQNLTFLKNTHVQNMHAANVTPKQDIFFENINNFFEYGQHYEVFEAEIDGEKAAVLLVFYHKNTVEYYMPAIALEHRNKQPMSALIFYVMQYCIKNGFTTWNWGGTPLSNENLYRFKARFGAQDMPYSIQTQIVDKTILSQSSEILSKAYPGMFVAPYDALMP